MDSNSSGFSALPVSVDLRKMLENLVLLTEPKGGPTDQLSVDVVVAIADDVPSLVSLDKIYTFRVNISTGTYTFFFIYSRIPDTDERMLYCFSSQACLS